MLRHLPIAVGATLALATAACSIPDDAELTSLSAEQQSELCAEGCVGYAPYELDCDSFSVRSEADEAECARVCEDFLGSLSECSKTAGDWRRAARTGPDATCDEHADAIGEAIAIAQACR
jgi:hypothetical protein